MALTFKQLQDKVLGWLDETDDSTVVLANVKEALNAANAKRAGAMEWAFMLDSAEGVLIPDVREYTLMADINTILYVYNETQGIRYRQVPLRHWVEGEDIADAFVFDGTKIIFLFDPTAADTVTYRYYRQPVEMENDADIPDLPYPYSRLLIYDALIDLGLYSEDISSTKLSVWGKKQQDLELDLMASRLDANSLGSAITSVREADYDASN